MPAARRATHQFDALRCRLHWAVRGEIDPALVNRRISEVRLTCWCVESGSLHVEVGDWSGPLPRRRWFLLPIASREQRAAPRTVLASLHIEASWCDGTPLLGPARPCDLGPAAGCFGRRAAALIEAAAGAAPGSGRAWRSGGLGLAAWLTVEARLRDCLAELVRMEDANVRAPADGDELVRRALARIATEDGRRVTPGSLDEAAGLSRSQLARRFRSALGRSPRQVIADARLAAAQAALVAGRPVAAIARAAGFRHPTHFAAWFRHGTGMSPSAWAQGAHV